MMPCVAARVQDRPFGLVQMACGPTASQPPGPPGQPGGRVAERGLAASWCLHRGQAPGGAAVGGHEELLADHAVAGLRAHGDDRVATGDDAVDGLEDAPLLLTGIHADGQRRRALVRCGVYLLAGGQRAELRAVAGQQGEGQDSHRDEDDDGDDDGGRSAAEQRVPGAGAPGPGQLGFQQHGCDLGGPVVGREFVAGRARADRAGRTGPQRGCGAGSPAAVGVGRSSRSGRLLGLRSGGRPGSRLSVDRGAERHRQAGGRGAGRGCAGRGGAGRGCRSRGRPGAGPA